MKEKLIKRIEDLISSLKDIDYDNYEIYKKRSDLITRVLKDGDKALWGQYEAVKLIKEIEYIIKSKA